ncbi:hypothetical protein NBCG_01588 [Nocardioidaceae bacterium Broad-1]|nr:hypothetical protein NBCG_01588 [Nocardioidaceae bacterium Broad-1]
MTWDPATAFAIEAGDRNGVPARSLALYARWWQLETWLRELVHVELEAKHGEGWLKVVARANGRQAQDAVFAHMESADSRNPLAYLDYSQLLEIIAAEWDLFEPTLIRRSSWEGRQDDLKRIRHRIGHVRKAHSDDLERIEQVLRDLERGAFIAAASYNRRFIPPVGMDPITTGWLAGEHPTARRLLASSHAKDRYEIHFDLEASRRPWATSVQVADPAPGLLWHVEYILGSRVLNVPDLWRNLAGVRGMIVHLVATDPQQVTFTFSGADRAEAVSNAIGVTFDAVIRSSRPETKDGPVDDEWHQQCRDVDFRVVSGGYWDVVDESTVPITLFSAGGRGVSEPPVW